MKRPLTFIAPAIAALALLAGCGKNEVIVEVRGGDGRPVRLDAHDLAVHGNRLVQAGTYRYPELKSGSYRVAIVTGSQVESRVVELASPPMTGVAETRVVFDLPAGSNPDYKAEGTLLYAATPSRVRNWNLFTLDVATGQITQLTDTREFEQHPEWSPDGQKIAFTQGDVMTNVDIWVMNADGSGRTRLTEHPERDARPAWSPDGSQIAFVSQREGDVSVWLMDADGGNQRKLVQGRAPVWSPDGTTIAFTSSAFEGNDEIYLINADGSDMRRLTDDKRIDWQPAWSPDGGRLAFASERFGGQELLVAGGDFTNPVRITVAENTFEVAPVWSPDGHGLAYSGKMTIGDDGELVADDRGRPEGSYDIYLMSVTGYDWDDTADRSVLPRNLTNTPDIDEHAPSWRPF